MKQWVFKVQKWFTQSKLFFVNKLLDYAITFTINIPCDHLNFTYWISNQKKCVLLYLKYEGIVLVLCVLCIHTPFLSCKTTHKTQSKLMFGKLSKTQMYDCLEFSFSIRVDADSNEFIHYYWTSNTHTSVTMGNRANDLNFKTAESQ